MAQYLTSILETRAGSYLKELAVGSFSKPANNPFWEFKRNFSCHLRRVLCALRSGDYSFGVCGVATIRGRREPMHVRPYEDRLVLKALLARLKVLLRALRSPYYFAREGRGRRVAISALVEELSKYSYVYKTDIASYYRSISLDRLEGMIFPYIRSRVLRRMISSALRPVIEKDGNYFEHKDGLPMGCSISPLFAEIYLVFLDHLFGDDPRFYYQRYMDDIIILARTKWDLKKAIRELRKHLSLLGLKLRYEKTFRGKTTDVISYLGYRIISDEKNPMHKVVGVSRESKARSRARSSGRKALLQKAGSVKAAWAALSANGTRPGPKGSVPAVTSRKDDVGLPRCAIRGRSAVSEATMMPKSEAKPWYITCPPGSYRPRPRRQSFGATTPLSFPSHLDEGVIRAAVSYW